MDKYQHLYEKNYCIYKSSHMFGNWLNDKQAKLIVENLTYYQAKQIAREYNNKDETLTSQGYSEDLYRVCSSNEWHNNHDIEQLELCI